MDAASIESRFPDLADSEAGHAGARGDTVPLCVRLPRPLLDQIDAMVVALEGKARWRKLTRSDVMRYLIVKSLDA